MYIYTHSYVLIGRAPACHVRSTGLILCTLISCILLVPLFNFIIQLFIVIFFSPHDSEVSYHMSAWYVFFMVQKSPITCMLGLFLHDSEDSCHMYAWFVFSLFRSFLSHVCLVCYFRIQKFSITCILFFSFFPPQFKSLLSHAYLLIPNFLTLAQ